ncbi:hypothetical protein LUX33_28450 [Actinomadura madurae]|uniref:hypothetical protein n=1 Tax=Actinomadura madurae TaxID=1993 RepID=UPI0020D25229|nr:hypothetical protein [Actinomadura madurae]MCP9951982.1 hypothetical protein [Actinomadura madurae]
MGVIDRRELRRERLAFPQPAVEVGGHPARLFHPNAQFADQAPPLRHARLRDPVFESQYDPEPVSTPQPARGKSDVVPHPQDEVEFFPERRQWGHVLVDLAHQRLAVMDRRERGARDPEHLPEQ